MASLGLTVKRRLVFLLLIFSVSCILLVARLAWLQLVQGAELQEKAFEQQIQNRIIRAKRGTIYDRNMKELAVSASADAVSVYPPQIKDAEKVSRKLAEILNMDYETVYNKVSKNSRYEIIARKLDTRIGDRIRQWIGDEKIPGVNVDEDSRRVYPGNNLAAHAIGYTGIDNQGLDGLEKVMDEYLKGVPGRIVSESDVRGRDIPFKQERYIEPQNGYNLVLTIDETIQHFAEQALENAMADYKVAGGGIAIVMNPRTGDILAISSKPDYNLNDPKAAPSIIDKQQWDAMSSADKMSFLYKRIWRNKAVSDTYEPGSTFKIITTAAGLEEGVTRLDDKFVCAGSVNVAGVNIKCWRYYRPHGAETLVEGVQNSCNPVFIEIGQRLGVEKFYRYIKAFGFGQPTGIILSGEARGIFHDIKKVGPVELATISFGQRFQITPLQMISAASAVANGGKLMKPRLIKEITADDNSIVEKIEPEVVRQVLSEDTSGKMRYLLENVVTNGTGRNAYVKGYRVAGKTGTSEKGVHTGKYIASFVGFAPADDPQVCVLVVLDEPGGASHMGGVAAAPVVGKIIEDTLRYLEVEPRYTENDAKMKDTTVPEVKGKKLSEARKLLTDANLVYKIEGDGNNNDAAVVEQTPKPFVTIAEKSTVILYLYKPDHEDQVVVPDVTDKNILEATDALSEKGLNIKITGLGSAVKQEPATGTKVPKGSIVNVEFKQLEVD